MREVSAFSEQAGSLHDDWFILGSTAAETSHAIDKKPMGSRCVSVSSNTLTGYILSQIISVIMSDRKVTLRRSISVRILRKYRMSRCWSMMFCFPHLHRRYRQHRQRSHRDTQQHARLHRARHFKPSEDTKDNRRKESDQNFGVASVIARGDVLAIQRPTHRERRVCRPATSSSAPWSRTSPRSCRSVSRKHGKEEMQSAKRERGN